MGKALDLKDQKFGRLAAIRPTKKRAGGSIIWECLCVCGKICLISTRDLRSNDTKSCGCLQKEKVRDRLLTHGLSNHSAYQSWWNMICRCEDPVCPQYKYYGKRGISVCEYWHKFENFFEDMGEKPKGLTLERKDNDGNYEPGNCKWATRKEQAANTRKLRWFRAWRKDKMFQLVSKNQNEFARQNGLCQAHISDCLTGKRKSHKGWIFQAI